MSRISLLIFIGVLFGAHFVSQIAYNMVRKASATLPPSEREAIYQRQVRYSGKMSILYYAAIGLLALGLLKMFGVISGGPRIPWGLYCMAGSLALFCIDKVIRSWLEVGAFRAEASEPGAVATAVRAALLVTVFELALAVGVCWWIVDKAIVTGGRAKPPAATKQGGAGSQGGKQKQPVWITKDEAMRIIGKDETYFDVLAEWDDFQTRETGGEIRYLRNDVETRKQAELFTLEDMQKALEKRKAPPAPKVEDATPPQPVQPPKPPEGERLTE